MHACTVHKFVHASFSAGNNTSRICDFEKMAVTPSKTLKTTWLSQSGKFLGGFRGVCFLNFFDLVYYFFRKLIFLILNIFKIPDLRFLGGRV